MASPKEQHDSRRQAVVVGTARASDRDPVPGTAHAAGTGSEPPDTSRREPSSGTPRPDDPEVPSSEEP